MTEQTKHRSKTSTPVSEQMAEYVIRVLESKFYGKGQTCKTSEEEINKRGRL